MRENSSNQNYSVLPFFSINSSINLYRLGKLKIPKFVPSKALKATESISSSLSPITAIKGTLPRVASLILYPIFSFLISTYER